VYCVGKKFSRIRSYIIGLDCRQVPTPAPVPVPVVPVVP
jgi:hypothetical protein